MNIFRSEEHFRQEAGEYVAQSEQMADSDYSLYKSKDPFPSIPSALLNSADIYKYIQKTGMIYPFYPDKLKGATYQVKIGGNCTYWDEKDVKIDVNLDSGESFTLKRNSIVFVELEPFFRVPDYLVLRFNLKISHVYKGLLLGTGPIVDPGFRGKLNIPLHNLTNNEYIFKKGDALIEMEFTKLSPNNSWEGTEDYGINGHYISFPDKKFDRGIAVYIKDALEDAFPKDLERGNGTRQVVNNAVPVAIRNANESSEEALTNSRNAVQDIQKIKKYSYWGGIIAILTTVATLISITVAVFTLIADTNARLDNFQLNPLEFQIQEKQDFQKRIDDLTIQIEDVKKEKLELENSILEMQKTIDFMQEEVHEEEFK